MREGLESKCVGNLRLYSIQRTSACVCICYCRYSKLQRNLVEGSIFKSSNIYALIIENGPILDRQNIFIERQY